MTGAEHGEQGDGGLIEAIAIPPLGLQGTLSVPPNARGIVLFAHGSGSSRLSPRNRSVAGGLNRGQIGTLLFDLLTEEEALDRRNVFDIPLLADRLAAAHDWLTGPVAGMSSRPIGYFGASTGAAAALRAAAAKTEAVSAVVSRGGRPDLADDALPAVTAPTLLLVGAHDTEVLALNRAAFERLQCVKRLTVVPGATHLFEEPGALARVTGDAVAWFRQHLGRAD
jgi:putative phosphoribosyl transferase